MIASLYHRGSAAGAMSGSPVVGERFCCGSFIISGERLYAEHMRRLAMRIQRDIMVGAVPGVARASQQIARHKWFMRRYADVFGRQVQPSGLRTVSYTHLRA